MRNRWQIYLLLIVGIAMIFGLSASSALANQSSQQTSGCKVEEKVHKQAKITYDGVSEQLSIIKKDFDAWESVASLSDKYIPEPWAVYGLAGMVRMIQPKICVTKVGEKACDTVNNIFETVGLPFNPFDFDPGKFVLDQGKENYQRLQDGLVEAMTSDQFWENALWGAARLEANAGTLLAECQGGEIPNAIQFADGDWPKNGEVDLLPETDRLAKAGRAAFEQKDYFQSAVNFSEAILLQPNSAILYYSRGTVYAWDGNYDKALDDFRNAIDLNPNNPLFF